MSDTPSTSVHELAERITKLLGVTPDENTNVATHYHVAPLQRRSMLARTMPTTARAWRSTTRVRPARKRRPCSTPRAVSHHRGAAKDHSPAPPP
jgi:hypothetical protein